MPNLIACHVPGHSHRNLALFAKLDRLLLELLRSLTPADWQRPATAWQVFTKALRPAEAWARAGVIVIGREALAWPAFGLVAVMG